ncbi:MAG TPA: hypothetical protein PKA63_13170 [Oligoflexia bacterium]|nr:hypothetical protein [Oligoflexia bacterium]HMP49611.1 hypothetical protein [Oligoflexia bacterium]
MLNESYYQKIGVAVLFVAGIFCLSKDAFARDVNYTGKEVPVYVTPGEPSQINFPSKIAGGFRKKHSSLALERQGNFLVVFAQPEIPYEGEALLVHLDDKRSYALRILPADDDNGRDEFIQLKDLREDYLGDGAGVSDERFPIQGYAPPSIVPGLMREMILISEFGKRGGIPGYSRSNTYSGESVLHDGTVSAKVKEMFLGTSLWGYVIEVENLLDTTHKINPAAFRLDGTRAVLAERWELAPRPETAEQSVANAHKAKLYIVTKSLRR